MNAAYDLLRPPSTMSKKEILLSAVSEGLIYRDGGLSGEAMELLSAIPKNGLIADYMSCHAMISIQHCGYWAVGKIHDARWWSNGHIATKGEWPNQDYRIIPEFQEILRPSVKLTKAVAFFMDQEVFPVVVFDCGVVMSSGYYDYFCWRFPGCTFWTTEVPARINVEHDSTLAGIAVGLDPNTTIIPEEFASLYTRIAQEVTA